MGVPVPGKGLACRCQDLLLHKRKPKEDSRIAVSRNDGRGRNLPDKFQIRWRGICYTIHVAEESFLGSLQD